MKGNRPYTWEEIKIFLEKELKKTKHIMTFGTIGSCDVSKDIDLIITKKPNSSIEKFYIELHRIFDNLDNHLVNKYKARAIIFSTSSEQDSLLYVSKYGKNDLAFHTMVYITYPQMQKDWAWALFPNDNLKDILMGHYICIIGDKKDIFYPEFQKGNYYDSIFNFIYLYDKINSHCPKEFLIKYMNHAFDYIYRKRLGLKAPVVKNEKDVKKYFYQLCVILDKLSKEKGRK
ncbi:MAG: hypothetical protein AABW91_01315 [Nanoarchaeota archaeon]